MAECINTIGFIFSKVNTIIKCDKKRKYCNPNYCCSNSYCSNNNYKICVFKLTKENFASSTLNISTHPNDAWTDFKNNVVSLLNAYFIISVTKSNKLHSFNAKFIKYKKCDCCDAILLYFKYNIIPYNTSDSNCTKCITVTSDSNIPITSSYIENYWPSSEAYDNNKLCYNNMANFSYKYLKSSVYTDVKFFYNDKYTNQTCFITKAC